MNLFMRFVCTITFTLCAFQMPQTRLQAMEITDIEPTPSSPAPEQYRRTISQEHLSHRCGMTIPQSVWMDACCSGGGYRAMIATAGFVAGLQEIGFYDCLSAMAGLSGSTWMMGPFMARGTPIDEFTQTLKSIITNGAFFHKTIPTIHAIAHNLEKRFRYDRRLQIVDLYGGFITDRLMSDMGAIAQNCYLNDFATTEHLEHYPFPIFTAIHPHALSSCCCCLFPCKKTEHQWIEMNPWRTHKTFFPHHSIETRHLGYVPTRISTTTEPLLPLSTIMGICGSAYSLSIKELIKHLLNHFETEERMRPREREYQDRGIILRELISSLRHGRLAPGMVPNFTNCDEQNLTLIDAGIDINLPFPPLLERRSPIIIVCDADGSKNTATGHYPALRKAAAYAQKHFLPFPSMKNPIVKNDYLLVFKDPNPVIPTILYFHNPIQKSTFEFNYTAKEFDDIYGAMYNAVVSSAESIREEIIEKAMK